ncbi:sigma D regulator [Spartinivicinus poritis]|uniref:Sigma D regulator n=1 Tax=Spartinivicinus poritis TaxID=2994640 RepID=A0ABT5UFS1_9GAMM|nr:sigma D regulator [Spartinivicinus sp. A2-2]MDE1465235.1 sigma D regulator [Spartinivicinus sp. A2-2]
MLESCKTAKERWGGVSEIIDRWLNERQELLVIYCKLSGLNAFDSEVESEVLPEKIQAFCQILVDYISAGHFEVYEQLLKEGKEFNDGGLELAGKIYPKIQATTEMLLNFNDKFDTAAHCNDLIDQFPSQLSVVGQVLEERFTLEDQLIEVLHNAHKELVV